MTIAPFHTDDQHDTIDVVDVIGSMESTRQQSVPLYECTIEQRSEGSVHVHVAGEIDLAACGDLQRALNRASLGSARVLVDLSDVTFMSPRAVGAIAEHPIAGTGRITVLAPTRPTRLLFDLFGAGGLLEDEQLW
ncbi:STAS domain-containing protein [Gordonia mangrovi]|nr:STAS domain-containing protein [Gordonia mangrovi]UVF76961.1 STAS domain-containing protein [Gordonia mangrovi]